METCPIDQQLADVRAWFLPETEPDEHPRANWTVTRILPRISRAVEKGDLATRFDALRIAWHQECGLSSSFTEITRSPSYRKIVGMGDKVLPLIFRDLERSPEPDYWFDALVEITKANPVPAKDRGYSRRMAKAWLKWARANRYA